MNLSVTKKLPKTDLVIHLASTTNAEKVLKIRTFYSRITWDLLRMF